MPHRGLLLLTGLAISIPLGLRAAEQQTSTLKIVTAGGLLGMMDGMYEFPGGPYDERTGLAPYGGLLGLANKIAEERKDGDLLLLQGDNMPHGSTQNQFRDEFLRRLSALNATAVALGSEDLLRIVDSQKASGLAPFLGSHRIPFLATNLAIRETFKGLNTVEENGFRLDVPVDTSVDWRSKLVVFFPCRFTDLQFELGPGPTPGFNDVKPVPAGNECKAELVLKMPLLPGTKYTLSASATIAESEARHVSIAARLEFTTDRALTPYDTGLPGLSGLPVIVPHTGADAARPVVAALVDPGVKDLLPPDHWRWKDRSIRGREIESEIVVLDPVRTMATMRTLITKAGKPPIFAVISGLADEDTLSVINAEPADVRVLVLHPDSDLLGQRFAANKTKEPVPEGKKKAAPPYSGDRGAGAVLDSENPLTARAWLRPEWIGEVIAVVTTTPTLDKEGWKLAGMTSVSAEVPGWNLCVRSAGSTMNYFAARIREGAPPKTPTPADAVSIGSAPAYRTLDPLVKFDAVYPQAAMWTSRPEFSAMVLDTMRTALNADVALAPDYQVDDEMLSWLKYEAGINTVSWLSKFILERVLYRAGEFVRIKVKGADLPATLARIIGDSGGFCASGIGDTSCGVSKIDAARLRVNSRAVDGEGYYTVALPRGLAAKNKLIEGRVAIDVLDRVDQRLRSDVVPPPVDVCLLGGPTDGTNQTSTLGGVLEQARANLSRQYIRLSPVEFGFSRITVAEPDDAGVPAAKLPVDQAGAKDTQAISVAGSAEIAFWEGLRSAVRLAGTAKYKSQTIAGVNSNPDNEFRVILAHDRRVKPGTRRWRFVIPGVSFEGQWTGSTLDLSPERIVKGLADPERPGTTLPDLKVTGTKRQIDTKPKREVYALLGMEFNDVPLTDRLSLTLLRGTAGYGWSFNQPLEFRINGELQTASDFTKKGPGTLLNEYYKNNLDTYSVDTPLDLKFGLVTRKRVEVDAKPKWTMYEDRGRSGTIDGSIRLQVFPFRPRPDAPLSEKWSVNSSLNITIPAGRLLSVKPYISYFFADIRGADDHFSVLSWGINLQAAIFGEFRRPAFIW